MERGGWRSYQSSGCCRRKPSKRHPEGRPTYLLAPPVKAVHTCRVGAVAPRIIPPRSAGAQPPEDPFNTAGRRRAELHVRCLVTRVQSLTAQNLSDQSVPYQSPFSQFESCSRHKRNYLWVCDLVFKLRHYRPSPYLSLPAVGHNVRYLFLTESLLLIRTNHELNDVIRMSSREAFRGRTYSGTPRPS